MDADPPRGVLASYVMTRVRDLAGGDRCPVPLLARPASPVAPSVQRDGARSAVRHRAAQAAGPADSRPARLMSARPVITGGQTKSLTVLAIAYAS
ncbi:hypothetical protein SHIRM173S_01206 [Streptomyces hirsutus]